MSLLSFTDLSTVEHALDSILIISILINYRDGLSTGIAAST